MIFFFRRCYSKVGRQGGEQIVSLGDGCSHTSTAMHELMHAVGFFHENTRYDRDRFVKVLWWNIQYGKQTFLSSVTKLFLLECLRWNIVIKLRERLPFRISCLDIIPLFRPMNITYICLKLELPISQFGTFLLCNHCKNIFFMESCPMPQHLQYKIVSHWLENAIAVEGQCSPNKTERIFSTCKVNDLLGLYFLYKILANQGECNAKYCSSRAILTAKWLA